MKKRFPDQQFITILREAEAMPDKEALQLAPGRKY
jgi:hypothetical protein